ncbi:MAG: 2-C-methyl-D-erythritol 4-phosphate cytidylyltransferase [Dysgonamonadaceae bacterium]|jgi:2-C-methyl-D-erythritol 4-phosphate cytidylyltransferase|nr:2-C-methyl-D-erythritol 4-phosphate cytidylyltransferase [Dysgonamonadaceae bacterium]
MNVAIILAGGKGERMGGGKPKQFLEMGGKTILEHSVNVFEQHPGIDETAIVTHKDYIGTVENMITVNKWEKVGKIIAGGIERYESSLAAIQEYISMPDCKILIHDAVRPLVSRRIIDDVIKALEKYNAVNVTLPVTDTIIVMDESRQFVNNIPDRRKFHRGQSPQGFRCSTLAGAYEKALSDPAFIATDDCGVVAHYLPEEKIFAVAGEESNMKLTYREDISLIEKYMQKYKLK